MTAKTPVYVYVYWDNSSNIFLSAKHCCGKFEGSEDAKPRLRIDFGKILELAVAGRPVKRALAVGSIPPELSHVWGMLAAKGVEVDVHHRATGQGEQEVLDEKLQLQMMIDTIDHKEDPGTAVVMTGDGSGFMKGGGFWAALQRMKRFGWGVEVLSWSASCHRKMRQWVEQEGVFVELDKYYLSITYLLAGLLPTELPRHPVPLKLSGRELAIPAAGREVIKFEDAPPTPEEDWDADMNAA